MDFYGIKPFLNIMVWSVELFFLLLMSVGIASCNKLGP